TAAFKVASSALVAPRGGMAPLPLTTISMTASMPLAVRADQAALSPSLGAPATPAIWQARQADLYSFSPSGLVSPAADARAGASPATRMATDANLAERLNISIYSCALSFTSADARPERTGRPSRPVRGPPPHPPYGRRDRRTYTASRLRGWFPRPPMPGGGPAPPQEWRPMQTWLNA